VPTFETAARSRRQPHFQPRTQISMAYHPGDFYCRYRISFPDVWTPGTGALRRIAYFVMDLKVYGANMHLCVPSAQFNHYCELHGAATPEQRFQAFREAFHHTLTGAETAGCKVNDRVLDLELEDQALSCLVVVRSLSPTFLSDPAEQLYLAQDVVAELRSFWRERPEWFPEAASTGQTSAAARANYT
jgi:hypothetical protein